MSEPPKAVGAIFDAAIELPPELRAAHVRAACAGDDLLRQRVEALLRAHDSAGSFMGSVAVDRRAETPVSNPAEQPGDRIGRYKLLQQIGEGGCGVVYMAEQEEPVRRRVALKVIKLGMDTKSVIARFEAERQALALMDHPNIAKVLDAGATDTGRPYFVMELVRGVKITDYCDHHNLSTERRLELFIQVCQAIQHAHQKGVIHRDIKPSNILVTVSEPDGPGCPKVIDFGIAKATTGQRLSDKTLFTAFEQFIGTPAYMSPEQAMMTSLDIDTRTDIYALGVLLYELLTGKTPFDQTDLLAAGLDEMRRTIREKEPARPSTRLTQELAAKTESGKQKAEIDDASSRRLLRVQELIPLLRGDLDWIVMKALEKDRARRYETANGLAKDVQRYLADEPVVARPPSKLYRFQKLARRNKLAFAAGAAVLLALVAGMAVSTWEYLKERKAHQWAVAAERKSATDAAKATATSALLQQLLSSAEPDSGRGLDYTVRQLLDDFSGSLTNQLAAQPEVEATVCLTIGWTYHTLGETSKAEPFLRRAFDLRRNALGPQLLDTLEAEYRLAKFLIDTRRVEEGGRLARESWQGRLRILGAEHDDTLGSQQAYAEALDSGGDCVEAERMQLQILKIRERVLGPDNFVTINALRNEGAILECLGKHPEAEQYLRRAKAGFERTGLADQTDQYFCVKELAMCRLLQGDAAEAEGLLAEILPRSRKRLGPDDRVTLYIQRVRARALAELGKLDEAESLCRETLDALRRTTANQEGHSIARTLLYLGRVLVEQGKLDEAEPRLQEALRLFRADEWSKPRPELAAQAANWLGAIQLAREAYPEAKALLLPGSDSFFATAADMSPNERRLAIGHILNFYQASGKPEQAAALQKQFDALPKP